MNRVKERFEKQESPYLPAPWFSQKLLVFLAKKLKVHSLRSLWLNIFLLCVSPRSSALNPGVSAVSLGSLLFAAPLLRIAIPQNFRSLCKFFPFVEIRVIRVSSLLPLGFLCLS